MIKYMRVRPWGSGALLTGLPHTETYGVAAMDWGRSIIKIKVGRHWLCWERNECRFVEITKAEFETDIEFGLWPQLKVKYCPKWWWMANKNYTVWRISSGFGWR
jgi:hypothetical protein